MKVHGGGGRRQMDAHKAERRQRKAERRDARLAAQLASGEVPSPKSVGGGSGGSTPSWNVSGNRPATQVGAIRPNRVS